MSHVRHFDHVGLTVADLDVVTAFFVALGLEVEGRTFVEGEFLDTVCGIPDSRTEIVMLKPPDDGTRLELSSFVRPDSVPGSPAAMAKLRRQYHRKDEGADIFSGARSGRLDRYESQRLS